MSIDVNILIGGAAGQGIQTVGDLLVQVCRRAGLYVFAVNGYESRIRGGHSNVQVRVSDRPIKAPCRPVHLLIAMTGETVKRHRDRLASDGLIIEVHSHPEQALSDGAQSLKPDKMAALMKELHPLAEALGRKLK